MIRVVLLQLKMSGCAHILGSLCFHAALNAALAFVLDKWIEVLDMPLVCKGCVGIATMSLQYYIIAEVIDWLSHNLYSDIPFLNNDKRPQKTEKTPKMRGYAIYFARWAPALFMWTDKWLVKKGHGDVLPSPFGLGDIEIFPNGQLVHAYIPSGPFMMAKYYLWLAALVQLSLVGADLFYGFFHHCQHNNRWLYRWTDHMYHHQFRYPLAREGTWLGFGDLFVSSMCIGYFNVKATSLLLGDISLFELLMCISFVHEMNCCDHSGKVMPFHSGFPLLPFLSQPLGLNKSVEAHEAHHNFNKFSYGLLGVYDRIAGTAQYAT
eukprot:TRINITY_DN9644_c0_g1_i1.p1 TRINITY_DN9644_c0_g1~~TRINITY_DN9644_c0_g1_i1.p1  ORF type:complete len:321 (-),score=35.15 TRINITY_DN9644_c0_g1_i1:176-1138(-)